MESRDKREELAKKIQALGKEEKEKTREYRSTEYKKEKEQLEHDSYKEHLEDLKQERLLRRKYARSLFILLCIWLLIILLIVVFQGFNVIYLSDAVLITLITTTTANIAAYFLIVTKHLFPKGK